MRSILAPFVALAVGVGACPKSAVAQTGTFRAVNVAQGLDLAIGMAFAPDGRLFVIERLSGNILIVDPADGSSRLWANVPVVSTTREARGLLAIAIDPDFLRNGYVYVSTSNRVGAAENAVVRLEEVGGVGTNPTVIGPGFFLSIIHNIGPLTFGTDGKLYVATGDAQAQSTAPRLDRLHGKTLRMNAPDGTIPADNPFGANSYVYSRGHRNVFGIAVHPVTGMLYEVENGEAGADEVNLIVAGGDYGWPMHEGFANPPDPLRIDPIHIWSPPIGPTGACFYSGKLYPPQFHNALCLGDWNHGRLTALALDAAGTSVLSETVVYDYPNELFDVVSGPDGSLWTLYTTGSNRGADRIDRIVHSAAPSPALALSAVSTVALGGSITVGISGSPGDAGVCWLAFSALSNPVPTLFGTFEVNPSIMLGAVTIGASGTGYRAQPLPNQPQFIGSTLHTQAAVVSSGRIVLTNADALRLF